MTAYREHIIRRDFNCCCLCSNTNYLHVHHIVTRGAGGKNEYNNLVTLCPKCHTEKAHGIDALMYRNYFQKYVTQFDRPENWDQIMIESAEKEKQLKTKQSLRRKEAYRRVMNDRRELNKEIKDSFKKKYGMTENQILYRAKKLARSLGITVLDARETILSSINQNQDLLEKKEAERE